MTPSNADRNAEARKFLRDTLLVAATQAFLKLRGLIVLLLLVRFLGLEDYGIWSQVLALVSLLSALSALNLHLPMVRSIAAEPEHSGVHFATLTVAVVAVAGAASIVVAVLAPWLAENLLAASNQARVLRAASGLILVSTLRTHNLHLFRAFGQISRRSLFDILISLTDLLAIAGVLLLGGNLLTLVIVSTLVTSVLVVPQTFSTIRLAGWSTPRWTVLRTALRFSLPAVPGAMSIWVMDRLDRFVIGHYLSARDVGVYSACYTLASLVMFIQFPLQVTLFPKVSSLWARRRLEAKRYVEVANSFFLSIAVPITVSLWFAGGPLLTLLSGDGDAASGQGPLASLIAAGIVLWGVSIMQVQGNLAAKRSLPTTISTAVGATTNLLGNFALVPSIGLIGAAIATIAGYSLTCATLFKLGDTDTRIRLWSAFSTRTALAAALMTLSWTLFSRFTALWLAALLAALVYVGSHAMMGKLWKASRLTRVDLPWVHFLMRRSSPPSTSTKQHENP